MCCRNLTFVIFFIIYDKSTPLTVVHYIFILFLQRENSLLNKIRLTAAPKKNRDFFEMLRSVSGVMLTFLPLSIMFLCLLFFFFFLGQLIGEKSFESVVRLGCYGNRILPSMEARAVLRWVMSAKPQLHYPCIRATRSLRQNRGNKGHRRSIVSDCFLSGVCTCDTANEVTEETAGCV